MSPSRGRRGTVAVLASLVAVVLSSCSSPSEVSSSDGGGDGAVEATSDQAQEALATAYEGRIGEPPTEPTAPPEDVQLWVVSCGESQPSCAAPSAATQEAAEAVGWDADLCDGQANPGGWGACVRQAVSAGADVIIPIGIDCVSIQQPFQEAADAGVTVIGGGGADCDAVGGPKLWASETKQLDDLTLEETYNLQGRLAAEWLIGRTDGQARVLNVVFTDPLFGPWLSQGLQDGLAECADCEVVGTLEVSVADLAGGTLAQKFSTALLEASDANGVFVPIGGLMSAGLAQAVTSSGRSADLHVISGLGSNANLDLIRSDGGQDAIVGYPTEWGGWGAVDTAIRVLNGEEPLVQGNGYRVVDAENNLPAAGEDFTGGVDYQAAYRQAWGI